jgi:hypothetical protein
MITAKGLRIGDGGEFESAKLSKIIKMNRNHKSSI